jgi:hypothetical protein
MLTLGSTALAEQWFGSVKHAATSHQQRTEHQKPMSYRSDSFITGVLEAVLIN